MLVQGKKENKAFPARMQKKSIRGNLMEVQRRDRSLPGKGHDGTPPADEAGARSARPGEARGAARQGPRSPPAESKTAARTGNLNQVLVAAAVVAAVAAAAVVLKMQTAPSGGSSSNGGVPGRHDSGSANAAALRRREEALAAALDEAFAKEAGELLRSQEAGMAIARDAVYKTLLRREKQQRAGTIKRAVTFHFAGDFREPHSSKRCGDIFAKVVDAVAAFVMADSANRLSQGQSVLHIGKKPAEWDGARKRVAEYLVKNPMAVVVIHNADMLPESFERLYDLEDAFEMPHLQNDGVLVDTTGAVFILQTSLGQELAQDVCGGVCDPSHG